MLATKTHTLTREEIVNLVRFEHERDPVFSTKLLVHRRLRAGSSRSRTTGARKREASSRRTFRRRRWCSSPKLKEIRRALES